MRDLSACSNQHLCPCPNGDCTRHGHCCECVAAHRERGNLPLCIRFESRTGEEVRFEAMAEPCGKVHGCVCPSTDCKIKGRCCECVVAHREGGTYPLCFIVKGVVEAQGE